MSFHREQSEIFWGALKAVERRCPDHAFTMYELKEHWRQAGRITEERRDQWQKNQSLTKEVLERMFVKDD